MFGRACGLAEHCSDFQLLLPILIVFWWFFLLDSPVCGKGHEEVLGALKHETLTLKCEVDASPPADSFHWTFNSSGEPTDLPARLHSSEVWPAISIIFLSSTKYILERIYTANPKRTRFSIGVCTNSCNILSRLISSFFLLFPFRLPFLFRWIQTGFSRLNYTPTNDLDYGTISCWGRNAIGLQKSPCIFQIISAGKLYVQFSLIRLSVCVFFCVVVSLNLLRFISDLNCTWLLERRALRKKLEFYVNPRSFGWLWYSFW